MEETKKETEIRLLDLWEVFLQCWWIVALVGVIVFIGLFIFLSANNEPEYTATTIVYVMKDSENSTTGEVSIANTLVNDYMELCKMDRVMDMVRHDLGLTLSLSEFRKMISVETISDTRFIYLSITAKTPQDASDMANSLAKNACYILNNDLLNGQPYASVANESSPPTKPSNPVSALKILLIAFACAALVYGVYFVRFLMDDKVNTPEDVEKYLGLSLLGQIPNKHDNSRKKKYYGYTSYTSTPDA